MLKLKVTLWLVSDCLMHVEHRTVIFWKQQANLIGCTNAISIPGCAGRVHKVLLWYNRLFWLSMVCLFSQFLSKISCKVDHTYADSKVSARKQKVNGNTLLEKVCIRLTWHLHNHDMMYVMNMNEVLSMFVTTVINCNLLSWYF